MFVISIFIMAIMLVMTVISSKNKFASVITLKMLLVSFMMITGTVYLTKSFSYSYISALDYRIYMAAKALKFDCIKLSRIYNACLMMYMLFSIIEIYFMSKPSKMTIIALCVPIALFFVFDDFTFMYRIFILSNTSSENTAVFSYLLSNMKYICFAAFVIYVVLPYAFGADAIGKTKIFTKKKLIAVELASFFIVDGFVYYAFVHGIFCPVFITNVTLFKIPESRLYLSLDVGGFLLASVLYFAVFGTVMFLIFFFGTVRVDFPFKANGIVGIDNMLNKHMSMHLHVYKNAFLAIGQQTNLALKKCGDGEVKDILKNIDSIALSYLSSIEKNLSQRTVKNKAFKKIEVSECISAAVEKSTDSGVKITGDFRQKQYYINGDSQTLTEAITNLLINALESVARTGREPVIDINLTCEEEFCMISVKDNGAGIHKRNLRKIFHSYYSTKPKSSCGGVGLNYVKNVVKKHRGEIKVSSKLGEYALFRMALPGAEKQNVF